MKNSICLIVLIFLFASCQQNNRKTDEKRQQLSLLESKISNDTDENLKDQLRQYNNALHGEPLDAEKVLEFIYSDTFTYLKKQNPNSYSKENVINLFAEPVRNLKRMAKENNVKYDVRAGEIVQKVNEGQKLIYKVEIFLDMEYGMEKHTTGDLILGISLDGGERWKFLEINPENTPEILRMKFNQSTINKII